MSLELCHVPGDVNATVEKEVTFDSSLHNSPSVVSTPSERLESVRESIFETTSRFKKRASQIILEVPVNQLRKIRDVEGIGSIHRETKHFSENTTLHGPKRIFHGKNFSCVFWICMTLASFILLILQSVTLLSMYFSRPTVSQVSFTMKDDGIEFPMVTLCNFNPIKKSYIRRLNYTGDFSNQLLDYLMEFLMDTQILYGTADRPQLHVGSSTLIINSGEKKYLGKCTEFFQNVLLKLHRGLITWVSGEADLQLYIRNHANFTVEGFFMNAGFDCEETMKLCSFGGRYFSCCKYMNPILTNLGKCYSLDMQGSDKEWMRRQTEAGVTAGLQIILDSHLEEQFDGTGDDPDPIYSDAFENGFRYYVHAPDTIPYLTSEGISVSPSTRVYSAISINSYVLLSSDDWGNCTTQWPQGFTSTLPYSAVNCASICKAKYFYEICGCSPFTYDIDHSYHLCTPYQTVQCIDQNIRKEVNDTGYFNTPPCKECKMECNSLVYHAYNSYGHGFSNGALTWLNKKNSTWSKPHMKSNFLTVNVFFRDMSYRKYIQIQATSLTETLSDVGGNMGMFLGMSMLTIVEVVLYLSKIGWIAFSKKRRNYMYQKKKAEAEQEKQLEETVTGFKLFRSRKDGTRDGSMRNTRARLRALTRRISDTLSNGSEITVLKKSQLSVDGREQETNEIREQFMTNCRDNSLYMDKDSLQRDSVIELKIDLRDLREQIMNGRGAFNVKTDVGYKSRRRASTVPAPRSTFFSLD